MTVLKSYTCSKCAGVLNFDSDQEFFDCPFCGNHYDFTDFHEDELIVQAEESLNQKAFHAASEKFGVILGKNPGSFEALRGLVLSEIGISSLDDLKTPEALGECNVDAAQKAIDSALCAACSEEDIEYFKRFTYLFNAYRAFKKVDNEFKAISAPTTQNRYKQGLDARREKVYEEHRGFPRWLLFPLLISCIVMVCVNEFYENSTINLICTIIPIVLIAAYWIIRPKKIVTSWIPENADSEYETINQKVNDLRTDYSRRLSSLLVIEKIARKEYSMKLAQEKDLQEAPKADYSLENLKPAETIACAKCGAMLKLDAEKRVYSCNYCGVAYGVSLFFGLPMEKALNSMNSGRFTEAKQRFSNVLMADPSDFEAHLGIILSEGHWSRVSDIDVSDEVTVEVSRSIYKMVRDAKAQTSDADPKYFEDLGKMISTLRKICENNKKIDSLKEEMTVIKTKTDLVHKALDDDSYDPNQMITEKLSGQIDAFRKENDRLNSDFAALRESVLAKKTDSVLAK